MDVNSLNIIKLNYAFYGYQLEWIHVEHSVFVRFQFNLIRDKYIMYCGYKYIE